MTRNYPIVLFLFVGIFLSSKGAAQSFHTAKAKPPQAGTMFVYPERIPLRNGGMFTAERGLIFVPLNRAKTKSDVIGVEVYRFPRNQAAKPETPPLFILNGGPGFEGLEKVLARRGNFEQRIQPLLSVSDVVVVGQRGIGSSKPGTTIQQSMPSSPADQPVDETKVANEFRKILSRERKVWEDLGVDLKGFTVLEAAADVNDVRRALGYEKIMIMGGSFGSHWGMAIMRQHPDIVARAILNGMEGPDHTYDHPGWIWNVYKRVAKEAENDERLKDLIPEGGLIEAAKRLARQFKEKPVRVKIYPDSINEEEVLIDGDGIKRLIRGYSGNLKSWPADIIKLDRGDYDAAAKKLAFSSGNRGPAFSTASYWMLDIGSGITEKRLAEYEADPAMDIIGSTFAYYSFGGPAWDSDLGDAFRKNFETSIPTVIVHGTWDQSTPYENAQELAPFFKNGKFITVERGSHGALTEAMGARPEFRKALMNFAVSGDTSDLPDQMELRAPRWTVPKIKKQDRE